MTGGRTTCSLNMEYATLFVVPLVVSGPIIFWSRKDPFRKNSGTTYTEPNLRRCELLSALRLEEVIRPGTECTKKCPARLDAP